MQRPFKVLGVQQIAIGGPSKEQLKKLWVDRLGLEITGNFVSERENVDEDICAMGAGPFKVEVDLMQPVDPEKKPEEPPAKADAPEAVREEAEQPEEMAVGRFRLSFSSVRQPAQPPNRWSDAKIASSISMHGWRGSGDVVMMTVSFSASVESTVESQAWNIMAS